MTLVDALLAGPRGRDFLLEVALASEREDGLLFQATWRVGDYLERNLRKFGIARRRSAHARAMTVAPTLERVPLVKLTPGLVYDALERTVSSATYWQPPMAREVFLSASPLRPGLRRIARHVAVSTVASGWSEMFRPDRHTSVSWTRPNLIAPPPAVVQALESWREEAQTESLWWSRPPRTIIATTGELANGSPGALRFVEDGFGWDTGWVYAATASTGATVFTIDGPAAWAKLCRRFPLDVTASKGKDWRLATGYPHDWVMPDFVQVAQHYDALHLSVRGYFAAAGRVIPVDEACAGMLAGWDPGQTFWFSGAVELAETPVVWRNHGDSVVGGYDWRRQTGSQDAPARGGFSGQGSTPWP